jgi:hypothetical protein
MKYGLMACLAAAALVLTGASVWEGAAAVSPGGDLPTGGYYVATNSFPRNTVVDITNLENGANIRVIVASGLETPGLLALISPDAAEHIGLRSRSIGRIRMSQPSDPVAFSRFTEGMATYGEPDYTAAIPLNEDAAYAPPRVDQPPSPAPNFAADAESGASIPADDNSAAAGAFGYVLEPEWEEYTFGGVTDLPENRYGETGADAAPAGTPPEDAGYPATGSESYDYTLVPAEERPPAMPGRDYIDPAYIIPGTSAPVAEESPYHPVSSPPGDSSRYSAFPFPLIDALEHGKYYVQVGAFSRVELIEPAVNRIHESYPLAIQSAGSGDKPVYRVLLGPMNLGESGAMLQRVKSIGYKDAFVRGN